MPRLLESFIVHGPAQESERLGDRPAAERDEHWRIDDLAARVVARSQAAPPPRRVACS